MESLWEQVLAVLERDPEISRASYATWLKGTRLVAREGSRFTVAAQHTFAREKLERSYAAAIARAVGAAAGETQPRVEFIVPGALRPPTVSDARALPLIHRKVTAPSLPTIADEPSSHNASAIAMSERPASPSPAPPPPLNPRFSFAAFLSGPETQLAVAATRAVADDPGGAFNPLFLHGAPGMGKTHLLHAVGGAALRSRPAATVCLLSAAQLTAEIEEAPDLAARAAVLARYAGVSLLLLDDVHELAGTASQKHVLHLVEALVAAGGQVVCAAASPPRSIAGLDDRLRSFLQSGLVAELAAPDDATRL